MSGSGIRVLGEESSTSEAGAQDPAPGAGPGADRPGRRGARGLLVRPRVVMALLGLSLAGVAGTVTFGLMWAGLQSNQDGQITARSVASRFVYDFTNFDAKSVGSTFQALQSMSTGAFAKQAKAQFTPKLRQELVAAKATTRGQVRYLYVQSYSGTRASYYAEVIQTYANDKTTSAQSDDLRLVVDLTLVDGHWKVSDVTSLGGASTAGG